jgi:hypothetical protein
MLKYPHVITDDSEYEDDEEVKKKDPSKTKLNLLLAIYLFLSIEEITKYIMKGS